VQTHDTWLPERLVEKRHSPGRIIVPALLSGAGVFVFSVSTLAFRLCVLCVSVVRYEVIT